MAVYSFSTQDEKSPKDKEAIDALKKHCRDKKLSFSAVVVEELVKLSKSMVETND